MKNKLSKKDKILKMLESKHWLNDSCCFTSDDFRRMDMHSTVEYREKYNDVIYARKVLQ